MAPGIKVYTPGVESRVIQKYESRLIVEVYGAGAGQLSVRINDLEISKHGLWCVNVYGPGVEPRVIQKYESKFIVETYGASTSQLSVRIRGPKGKLTWSLVCQCVWSRG